MANWLRGMRTRSGVVGEIFVFLWRNKRWWLLPLILALVLLGGLLALSTASGLAPFIYTLF